MKSTKFTYLIAFGIIICLLTLSACSSSAGNLEGLPVTGIELGSSHSNGIKDVYSFSSKPTYSEISELEKIYANAYANEELLSKDSGLEKAIRWVSSDPEVISVSNGYIAYKGDKLPLKVKINKTNTEEGIYEIYAENFDGSVKSDSVKIMIGSSDAVDSKKSTGGSNSKEADLASIKILEFNSKIQENYEILTGKDFKETMMINAYTGTNKNYKDKYAGTSDLPELIRAVSTNEAVAVSSIEMVLSKFAYLRVELVGEGETEIYVETIDGRYKTQSFKVTHGNKYNKEAAVIYDSGKHIISMLKYPTKTTTKITDERDPWFYNSRNKRVYTYKDDKESSYVEVTTTDISELNATVKGEVKTFSSTGMDVVCKFILELRYNSDFTAYTIVSEKYDIPEIIREKLE